MKTKIFVRLLQNKCIPTSTTPAFERILPFGYNSNEDCRNIIYPHGIGKNIITLCNSGRLKEAVDLLHAVDHRFVRIDFNTYAYILQECIKNKALTQCRRIHAHMIKTRFEPETFLSTKLVIMYEKLGELEYASQVFDRMSERNVVSWTSLIAGYMQRGQSEEALGLFYEMKRASVKPNEYTFATILAACAGLLACEQGRQVHACIVKTEFQSHLFVGSALLDMYAKCGRLEDARQVFDKMSIRDVVVCTAMIAGYAQQGHGEEALGLFCHLIESSMEPNEATLASVLSALAGIAGLDYGKQVHGAIIRRELQSHVTLANALVDMYGKCGSLEIARKIFDRMPQRDVVSWNAMISGYGRHGLGKNCVRVFEEMQLRGIKPDSVTFLALLSGCSHGGLVTEGWHYFGAMHCDYCIKPRLEHFACMVDLLGRAGRLNDGLSFISKIPYQVDGAVWGALLGACRVHVNVKVGKLAADHLFKLEPENPGNYVVLSNIYAAAGMSDEVVNVRATMREKGIKKERAISWIKVGRKVHTFFAKLTF